MTRGCANYFFFPTLICFRACRAVFKTKMELISYWLAFSFTAKGLALIRSQCCSLEREVTVSITRGLFLERSIRTQQAVVVYIQDRGFKSSANIITKLSVNKLRWTCLLARTSNFSFSPKSYREFRETGPWAGHKITGARKSQMLTCTSPLLSLVFCITLTLFPRFEGERYMYRALGTKRFYYQALCLAIN